MSAWGPGLVRSREFPPVYKTDTTALYPCIDVGAVVSWPSQGAYIAEPCAVSSRNRTIDIQKSVNLTFFYQNDWNLST